ncbi:hypothetical protein BDR03DRAFT_840557, partial [Suillus americanus]
SIKWTRLQLYNNRGLHKRRSPNAWNAFTSQKLNEANEDLPAGRRWRLPAFIAEHQQDLTAEYVRLSASQKEKLRHHVLNLRENRIKIVRSNPKALQKQVNAMFESMEQERFALKFESWVTGNFGKRVSPFHSQQNTHPSLDNHADATQRLSPSKLISLCRTNIQEGLNAINTKNKLSKKKINMNYDNYESKIVEKHGIILEG